MLLALSWFPARSAAALEAWPQLADDWGTADHTEYNRRLQRHLSEMPAAHGPVCIAPIRIRSPTQLVLTDRQRPHFWVRAFRYAAELARTASDELIAWPPSRNAPCWCHSGRKYKQCCGHPIVAATPAVQ